MHVVYGIGFSTLYYRNYYAAFPTELVRAAMIDGAGFFQIFWRIMLPVSGPITVVCVIWQFTNIWNDFLFGVSFGGQDQPMTAALNNLVQSSTGVKEYNVHFAGAILAALPTLLVYIVAGRYFVRGLMAGSVKGWLMGFLEINNVTKSYGSVEVLHDIDIQVDEVNFWCWLAFWMWQINPLNIIAGLESCPLAILPLMTGL